LRCKAGEATQLAGFMAFQHSMDYAVAEKAQTDYAKFLKPHIAEQHLSEV